MPPVIQNWLPLGSVENGEGVRRAAAAAPPPAVSASLKPVPVMRMLFAKVVAALNISWPRSWTMMFAAPSWAGLVTWMRAVPVAATVESVEPRVRVPA